MQRILLDTHAFIWWITDDPKLSKRARACLADKETKAYVSSVTGWEIAIKASLGRISNVGDPRITVPQQIRDNNFTPLVIGLNDALNVFGLPEIHDDPFDRLLVAQAIGEGLPILTCDRFIPKYDVKTIW